MRKAPKLHETKSKICCREFISSKYLWAYEALRHIRNLEAAFSIEEVPEEMENARMKGSAIMMSTLLNLVESVHGPEECVMRDEECVVGWARDVLDYNGIPNLNEREPLN